ncbi:hypothetical protein J3Q64DRAFT_1703037 [Phycomyces blakesleeanus]|uniref:Uncharacterized protein n=1 Tax=Phycomyces blakesleeanus TaxID=4837 RepID=A0ABR3AMM5_PHYBL
MIPKAFTNTNVFKTVLPRQNGWLNTLCLRERPVKSHYGRPANTHNRTRRTVTSTSKLNALIPQNSSLIEKLCAVNEHIFRHKFPVLQPSPPPSSHPLLFLSATKKATGKESKHSKLTTAQASRAIQPESRPSVYSFVYLPYCNHLKYSQVRKLLRTLKIQQSCVLEIAFPECGTLLLLVHHDFQSKMG